MAQGVKSDVPTSQAGARVPNDIIEKMKYIGKVTYSNYTNVVNEAIEEYIKRYESKNGKITEDQISTVLKKGK